MALQRSVTQRQSQRKIMFWTSQGLVSQIHSKYLGKAFCHGRKARWTSGDLPRSAIRVDQELRQERDFEGSIGLPGAPVDGRFGDDVAQAQAPRVRGGGDRMIRGNFAGAILAGA